MPRSLTVSQADRAVYGIAANVKKAFAERVTHGTPWHELADKYKIDEAALLSEFRRIIRASLTDDERLLLRSVQLIRLEKLHERLWPSCVGRKADKDAIRVWLKVHRELSQLMGLDAPKSIDLTSKGEKLKGYIGVNPDTDWPAAEAELCPIAEEAAAEVA